MIKIELLSERAVKFLEEDMGLPMEDVRNYDKEKWHDLRMKCFDIECAEYNDDTGRCSEKGKAAADVVDFRYCDIKTD